MESSKHLFSSFSFNLFLVGYYSTTLVQGTTFTTSTFVTTQTTPSYYYVSRAALDGNILSAGYTEVGSPGAPIPMLSKTSPDNGTLLWSYAYNFGSSPAPINDLVQCANGDIVMAGYESHQDLSAFFGQVIRVSSSGALIWAYNYGNASFSFDAYAIHELSDGTLIVGGYAGKGSLYNNNGGLDMYLMLLSANGIPIWGVDVGGSGNDWIYAITSIGPKSDILASGYCGSPGGGMDFCITRFTNNGTFLYLHSLGTTGVDEMYGHGLVVLSDDSFIAAGNSQSAMYLVQFDAGGNIAWSKTYGWPGSYGAQTLHSLIPDNAVSGSGNTNGYVAVGYTNTSSVTNITGGVIMRVDANGNVLRASLFYDATNGLVTFFWTIVPTLDGGYLIGGTWYGKPNQVALSIKVDQNLMAVAPCGIWAYADITASLNASTSITTSTVFNYSTTTESGFMSTLKTTSPVAANDLQFACSATVGPSPYPYPNSPSGSPSSPPPSSPTPTPTPSPTPTPTPPPPSSPTPTPTPHSTNPVAQAASTAASIISSSSPSSHQCQAIQLTASITTSTPGALLSGGTVTFSEGGSVVGTAPLSEGLAVLSLSSLRLGVHEITAAWDGGGGEGGNFLPSSPSALFTQTVNGVLHFMTHKRSKAGKVSNPKTGYLLRSKVTLLSETNPLIVKALLPTTPAYADAPLCALSPLFNTTLDFLQDRSHGQKFRIAPPLTTSLDIYAREWPIGLYHFNEHVTVASSTGGYQQPSENTLQVRSQFSGILRLPAHVSVVSWVGPRLLGDAHLDFALATITTA